MLIFFQKKKKEERKKPSRENYDVSHKKTTMMGLNFVTGTTTSDYVKLIRQLYCYPPLEAEAEKMIPNSYDPTFINDA